MRLVLLFACFSLCLQGAVIDRLAITVGKQVITELQLDEEIRVTAFLNHQAVANDLDTRRAAADRLIAQLLVEQEMRLSRYPAPTADDLDKYLGQIKAGFGRADRFDQALTKYGLNEAVLKEHLALQFATLQFVEYRFRPDSDAKDPEKRIDEALDAWLEESRKRVDIVYQDKSLQ
ncbi:MAG: hypothetical protein JOZ48_03550 [Acidobacteriaceae bacterium]|nr:hypothetical protein [Acidobacteriaceae bacterium]